MELLESMKKRRSVRKFQEKEVSNEIIQRVVEAAVYAPSWKNTQITRYYAVVDQGKKQELMNAMPDFNQPAVQSAPVVFVVTAIKKRSGYNREGSSETSKGNGWQMYDCALSNMLLCLEATEQGLGTVIMGYFDEDMIRQIVEIPETEEINAVIAIGYPDEMPEMPKRKGTDVILKIV